MMQILLYLPVIHGGYDRFLRSWAERGASEILLVGRSISDAHDELRKEARALNPEKAATYLNSIGTLPPVKVVEADSLRDSIGLGEVVLPDEEVCRRIVKEFDLKSKAKIRFDKTFLRWDRKWSQQGRPADFHGRITSDDTDLLLGRLALTNAQRSSDWWRQVGAVAVLDGQVVAQAHNQHLPSEYSPYFNSDPRNAFSRAVRVDLTTAIHAEAALISDSARRGQGLAGADLFVSTFPCPGCARLIAMAGFRRLFFSGGYSMLEGEEVLRSAGIELIFVDTDLSPSPSQLTLEDSFGGDSLSQLASEALVGRSAQEDSPTGSRCEAKPPVLSGRKHR